MSFWQVEAKTGPDWLPLLPKSSNFTLFGTNTTGTSVVRTMEVGTGEYSGVLRIVYKAQSSGPLNWDLQFTSKSSGRYRLNYQLLNLTKAVALSERTSSIQVGFGPENYTFSWSDIPKNMQPTAELDEKGFSLTINLGQIAPGITESVDPSIISSNVAAGSTAYTFQRKVFYEPKGRNYFVFYYDGYFIRYRSSSDGVNWSSSSDLPSGLVNYANSGTYLTPVAQAGQQVIVASGDILTHSAGGTIYLRASVGSISGSSISWGPVYAADTVSTYCYVASCTMGIRDVNIAISSDGSLGFSYNYYNSGNSNSVCAAGAIQALFDTCVLVKYKSYPTVEVYGDVGGGTEEIRSVLLPSDSQGGIRVVFEWHPPWLPNAMLQSCYPIVSGGCNGPVETVDGSMLDTYELSAVSDSNFGTHVVYRGTDGNVTYLFHSASGSSWSAPTKDIFKGSAGYPTITADQSTNDVYAFAIQGSSIVMRQKSLALQWSDRSLVYPITGRTSPTNLGSNLVSASTTNSSSIELVWTEGNIPYNAMFASIPIQTVWSPYSSPGDPWDGNGLAPYGQYFANLGESVSPKTGMLTVKQTDLSVPGRGLDLSITRVYTEPYSFLGNAPYNYEAYPWAPMGDGWQLNFPWLNNTSHPTYLHLWNGEGYRIPSGFWTGSTATLENHQGENFRLIRNVDGSINLYDKSGTSYYFNTTSHMLRTITDSSGNNTIRFFYGGNTISCITDVVNRAFTFSYSNSLLQAISQVTGTCASPGTTVRTINYANNGLSLTSVTDPAGRVTGYAYNATSGSVAPWLLSRVRYPTSWLSNYTYTSAPLGTQANTYRVNLQKTGPLPTLPSSPVRQFAYVYNSPVGDQIINSTVTTYNGTQVVTRTKYAFSFAGVSSNVTDKNNIFLRGIVQRFGVGGETPREIILLSPTQGYTNNYNYDLWGNLIYSRSTITSSPAKSHESFSAYYNDGVPPSFNTFQDTFSQGNYTLPDNPWSTFNGTWLVKNGVYNGTETSPLGDSVFAWANTSSTDLSLQSKVSVTRAVDTRPGYLRFGIFTHHTTSTYKWALVIHNIGSSPYLELLDESNAWLGDTQSSARNSCSSWTIPLVSYGIWYTFNVTIHGNVATGWVSAPGQSPCSVNGTFSSSSPAVSGMGFGLYSGTVSALFDNVTATTITPALTGTSFSNSFIQNGAPNSNIHGAPAGTAQLQNGAGSQPEETYYSYFPWGGLTQTKNRYDPPATQGMSNPLALDGSAVGSCSSATSSCQAAISTSHANDIIIVYASVTLDYGGPCSFAISDTAALAWFSRGPSVSGRTGADQLHEFWARSPNALVSDVVTESISGCGNNYNGLQVFGITGANLSIPLDPSLGLPVTGSDTISGQRGFTSTTTSTANPNDFLFAGVQHGTGAVPTAQSGFTLIAAGGGYGTEYKLTSSILSNYIVSFSFGTGSYWQMITDAVQSTPPTQWLTSSRTYDTYGNLKTLTDPRGNMTSYGFSPNQSAYLTSVNQTLAPGGTLISNRYLYNFTTGTMLSRVDPKGNTTTYKYDILGRVLKVTYPNNDFVSYTYNDAANYVNSTNENGWLTQQQYDGLARLSTVNRFLNGKLYSNTTNSYNWQDKTLTTRDPLGNTYNYSYDALGRITSSTTPDGKSVNQTYNDLASWVRTTNQDGNYACNFYDRLGRLISVVEYADINCSPKTLNNIYTFVTNYYYDEVGNLGMVTNAAASSTLYSYDNLNRLTNTIYQDLTFETYSYDNSGNLVMKVDRAGVKTLTSYDSMNRISTITYCGTPVTGTPLTSTGYTYDKNSNALQVLNENATVYYIYDARNRVLNETYAVNQSTRQVVDLGCSGSGGTSATSGGVASTYSLAANYNGELVNTIAYPNSSRINPDIIIKYGYDGLGRVLNVTRPYTGQLYGRFTYNKSSQVVGVQYGNGIIGNYTYDKVGRPSTITLTNPSSSIVMSLAYAYNKTGTVSSVVGQVNGATVNEQYAYDPLQRLTNAAVVSGGGTTSLSYQYDSLGNRLVQVVNGTTTTYSYLFSNNELTGSTTLYSTSYVYDKNGNLVSKHVNSATGAVDWHYTWSASNRLLKVTNSTGQALYAYDGGGRRVEAIEGGWTWYFAYSGTSVIYKNLMNTYNTAYISAAGLTFLMVPDSGDTYFLHADALGSVRMITYLGSTVVYTNNYQPFGQDNGRSQGSCCIAIDRLSATERFTGKPVSATTGLYYYYQRWYDSSTGRFISADTAPGQPSNPQTLNTYIYTVDRPTSVVDPTGLDSCNPWDWNTWGGCANNLVQTVNTVVVQPTANFVNNNIVKPIVNNVIVPLVKNVVIPYLKDYYNGLVATYNTLSNVGSQLWNGYQSFTKTINNAQDSFYHSVNQDLQGLAHDITHLHVTDANKFFLGLGECALTALIAGVAVEALPEAAIAAGTIDLVTYGTAAIGLGGIGYLGFYHGLYEVGSGIVGLGTGCVGNTLGALSTS
jgi:RHS repeat-associated protein